MGQIVTPEQMLKQIFTAEVMSEDWFSAAFLAQVPVGQLSEIVRQYRAALGALEDVQGKAPAFRLTFSTVTLPHRSLWTAQGASPAFSSARPSHA